MTRWFHQPFRNDLTITLPTRQANCLATEENPLGAESLYPLLSQAAQKALKTKTADATNHPVSYHPPCDDHPDEHRWVISPPPLYSGGRN
jgi:hypothetical protein